MASFTAGTTFTDGVANDVTAAKLGTLITAATPTSGFIQDRTAETVTATNDTLLIGDASDSNALKRITVANFAQTLPTAKITTGTIETGTFGTTTSTAESATTGTITTLTAGTTTSTAATITNLVSTTSTFNGAITGSTNTINIGSGQIYKDASGNIGIGTTSPGSIFHVANTNLYTGKLTFGGAAAVGTDVNNEATGNVYSEYLLGTWNLTRAKIRAEAGTGGGDGVGGGVISMWTGATSGTQTERMRIDSSGNVGIGTTSPARKLQVDGNCQFGTTGSSGTVLRFEQDAGNGMLIRSDRSDASGGRYLAFGTDYNERLRIDSSGNVGIGTTSPNGNLAISSSTATIVTNSTGSTISQYSNLGLYANSGSYSLQNVIYGSGLAQTAITTSTNSGYQIGTTSSSWMAFVSNNNEKMRIDPIGNCSIGTASALSKLHVHGDLTLSNTTTSTTGATGGVSKPATYAGFLTVSINGTSRKIPYYA